jgi:HSP20 family protein
MANITVRKGNGGDAPLARPREIASPFKAWRDLLRWDPFAEMLPTGWTEEDRALFSPDFDVKETPKAFVFNADLPGMEDKDIDVTITDNRLTISGKRKQEKEEKGDTFYRCERSYGSFSRSFTMPSGIASDKVKAELKNGVLNVEVPKTEAAKPKKVAIKAS